MIEYQKSPRAPVTFNNARYTRSGETLLIKLVLSDGSLIFKLKQGRSLSDHS